MTILPSSYLPSISYIAALLNGGSEATIDLGEHYVKRSQRNRTRIMTAQGVMELSIPICKANKPRQPMHTIEIDNSKRWQHQHWNTIVAAYRSSPYFDHYAPYFEPLYREAAHSLVEFNMALLRVVLKLLRQEIQYRVSNDYIESMYSDYDIRLQKITTPTTTAEPYIQVFSDRLPFEADLSIIDLLFCEGPSALDFLGVSCR